MPALSRSSCDIYSNSNRTPGAELTVPGAVQGRRVAGAFYFHEDAKYDPLHIFVNTVGLTVPIFVRSWERRSLHRSARSLCQPLYRRHQHPAENGFLRRLWPGYGRGACADAPDGRGALYAGQALLIDSSVAARRHEQ